MSDNIPKPKFISDKPADENFFGNNDSFTLIKNRIINIIKENQLYNKVIALSGKWGAGKNTIINMIKKEEKDIKVIEFDTLSLYNEHIKKSFLINLANELEIKETCKELEKSELEKSISGAVKKTTKKTGDKLYTSTKLIILVIFVYIIHMPIYKIVSYLGDMLNIFHHSYYKMCNLIISILLSIFILFLMSILLFFSRTRKNSETDKKNKDNKKEENNLCKKINNGIDSIIDVVFPFINSSLQTEETSSEETETGDITSSDFKKYYKYIVEQYYKKEDHCKSIAIVVDNFDRIETEKIKNILYDLYLFISVNNEIVNNEIVNNEIVNNEIVNNIFFIFLIDKEKLFNNINEINVNSDLNNRQFFEKIFPLIFDIPNISNITWIDFFMMKTNEAFSSFNFGRDILLPTVLLYKEFSMSNIIPRDIIYFINKVVSNYLIIDEGNLISRNNNFYENAFKASVICSLYTMFVEERKYLDLYIEKTINKGNNYQSSKNSIENNIESNFDVEKFVLFIDRYISKDLNELIAQKLSNSIHNYHSQWKKMLYSVYFKTPYPFYILYKAQIEEYIYNQDWKKIKELISHIPRLEINNIFTYFFTKLHMNDDITWVNSILIGLYYCVNDDLIINLFKQYKILKNIDYVIDCRLISIFNQVNYFENTEYTNKKNIEYKKLISNEICLMFIDSPSYDRSKIKNMYNKFDVNFKYLFKEIVSEKYNELLQYIE